MNAPFMRVAPIRCASNETSTRDEELPQRIVLWLPDTVRVVTGARDAFDDARK